MFTKKRAVLVLVVAAMGVSALGFGSIGAEGKPSTPKPTTPKRVLIVLFDQMRPEYADRFGMANFKRLRAQGTNFDKAYLGYMGSETVISHNVIVSGQLPKHQGWVDEAYRDTNGWLGPVNAMHITGDLSLANFQTLVAHGGYPKLADYLHAKFPGTKFITVGEKSYAVESAAATGTPLAGDIAVRMSSRGPAGECVPVERMRHPSGLNVPSYLTAFCGRYYVNSSSSPANTYDYGTQLAFPSWMYPEEANRFVPGTDPAHLGGDVWVADAAMAMMENEPNWSGMFVTLGGIDKTGHMWGADQDTEGHDCTVGTGQVHGDCAAKIADAQLGRMLDKLAALGQLDETLVVLTADHGATHGGPLTNGGTSAANFYGKTTSGAGDTNWYYGPGTDVIDAGVPSTAYNSPSPALAPLIATGNVQFSYQSTSIQTWLKDRSAVKKAEATGIMKTLPGVIASYWRDGDHFVLGGTNPMTKSEKTWWKHHGQEIIDGMAADNGPDVVGLLHDDTSYGVYGDHGGATEEVQRVPMVFWSSNDRHGKTVGEPFRTPDIMPTVLRQLGIPLTHSVDGRSHKLK
jgi:hypothetical protein